MRYSEALFIRQNNLNYSCTLLGSVSVNSFGKQKYVPQWKNFKGHALFTTRWEKGILVQLRFKDNKAESKGNIPVRKLVVCLSTRTLGSVLISLVEKRLKGSCNQSDRLNNIKTAKKVTNMGKNGNKIMNNQTSKFNP